MVCLWMLICSSVPSSAHACDIIIQSLNTCTVHQDMELTPGSGSVLLQYRASDSDKGLPSDSVSFCVSSI